MIGERDTGEVPCPSVRPSVRPSVTDLFSQSRSIDTPQLDVTNVVSVMARKSALMKRDARNSFTGKCKTSLFLYQESRGEDPDAVDRQMQMADKQGLDRELWYCSRK